MLFRRYALVAIILGAVQAPLTYAQSAATAALQESAQSPVTTAVSKPPVAPSPAQAAMQSQAQPELAPDKRGDLFMTRKQYREAIDAYRDAIPDPAVLYNKIGIAFHHMGDLKSAEKYYKESIRANRVYAEAYNNLGTILYARRDHNGAIREYRHALKLAPKSASIHSNLGTAFFAKKKLKEAFEAYQTALSLDPNVFESRNTHGVLLQERSIEDRALFHFELARLYARAEMPERALQHLRIALEEGYKERDKLPAHPDFAGIRELPEFQLLMAMKPRVL